MCELAGDKERPAQSSAEQLMTSYLSQQEEMPAINAIIGGAVANDIIKVVAGKGMPLIDNLFLYCLTDGAGWVERLE